jgi:hypothetical protein
MRRFATLASVSKRPANGVATPEDTRRLLDDTATLVLRAARSGADLVAFPEVYPQMACPTSRPSHAEPEEGGTLDAIRRMAREHKIYLVWPRYERARDGRTYNSAVLVDRAGEVAGRYHKMFPTIGEIEAGVVPGTDCPVFETDFGRVALIVCFDLNFAEVRDALRDARPDLVIFSSMYRGGLQCQEWALDLGCHVLTAITAELGRLVDPGGQVLQTSTYETLLCRRVNLNKRQLHMDDNWDKMDTMLARYGSDLTFEYYTQEGRFVVGWERQDRDVDEIVRESGLEAIGDYFARSRRVRREALERAKMPTEQGG